MEGLRPPKKPKTEVVPLTVEQVQLIAQSIQSRYSALVLFIAMSGLRPGEAFGVTKDRVDWLGRNVRVDRQLVTVGNEVSFSTLKTEASYRTVPLPTLAVELMSEHVRLFRVGESDLIFSNVKGEMIQRKRFGEVWRQTMKGGTSTAKAPTSCATTMPLCSSSMASPSRSFRSASGTRQPQRRSTPTLTSGLSPRTPQGQR